MAPRAFFTESGLKVEKWILYLQDFAPQKLTDYIYDAIVNDISVNPIHEIEKYPVKNLTPADDYKPELFITKYLMKQCKLGKIYLVPS